MTTLAALKLEIKSLAGFEFIAKTTAETASIVYGNDNKAHLEEFSKPGLYRVMSGSRGFIEEVEYLGEDESSFQVPSMEECIDMMVDEPGDDEQHANAAEYVGEWYFVDEDAEHPGVINFGYTEEEFDYYILVE